MARVADAPCYGLDYRLAPEHRFPAAVDDGLAGYRWVQARHPGSRLIMAGDSAGGGLALVTAIQARDAGLPAASSLVLFSPWTDLAITGASVQGNARACAMFTPKGMHTGAKVYLGDADPKDWRASPLYGDLGRLPPMQVFASRQEILLDDSTRLVERVRAAGGAAELELYAGVPHVWPIFHRLLPEGRRALDEVEGWLRGRAAA